MPVIELNSLIADVLPTISNWNSNTLNLSWGLSANDSLIIWSLINVLPEPGLPPMTVRVFHSIPSVAASLNLGHGVYIDFSSPVDLAYIYFSASLNAAYCPIHDGLFFILRFL